jgi:hypothetical protein
MKTWIIKFENSHFCGGDHTFLVTAPDAELAEDLADEPMYTYQRELFSDEYDEDPELDEECPYTVISVELFDKQHPFWPYRRDMETI